MGDLRTVRLGGSFMVISFKFFKRTDQRTDQVTISDRSKSSYSLHILIPQLQPVTSLGPGPFYKKHKNPYEDH